MRKEAIIKLVLVLTVFLLSRINVVHASPSDSVFQQSVNKLAKGNPKQAIKLLEDGDLNSFGEYYNLGVAYAYTKKWEKALWAFEAALKIQPSHEGAQFNANYSLAKLNSSLVWNHPFSWRDRFVAQFNSKLLYYLAFLLFVLSAIGIAIVVSKKIRKEQSLVLKVVVSLFLFSGVVLTLFGIKVEDHLRSTHFVLATSFDCKTYASVDGVSLENQLELGVRYPFLSESEEWIQLMYSDDRPVWVKKEEVKWY